MDTASNNQGVSVTNACSLNVETFEDAFSDENLNTRGMEASSSGDGVAVDNASNNQGASVTNACSLNVEIFEDAFSDEDVNTCGMEVGSSGDSVAVDHACGQKIRGQPHIDSG